MFLELKKKNKRFMCEIQQIKKKKNRALPESWESWENKKSRDYEDQRGPETKEHDV